MAIRNIVKIDEEKCNGCGLCVTACDSRHLCGSVKRSAPPEPVEGLAMALGEFP